LGGLERIVKLFVAVTDGDWFKFLSAQGGLDEVNFWQPGGGRDFAALTLGAPLLFKLHWPDNAIVGGGFFAKFTRLPVSIVWEVFGEMNGAPTYGAMRARIERLRRVRPSPREDYEVGCIVLEDPFFLSRSHWIPAPGDFSKQVVVGKGYDLSTAAGKELWERVLEARALSVHAGAERPPTIEGPMYGEAQRVRVRLHQGAFRVMVTDAYQRRCAISGEKALPVLQAAHIRPVADGGQHRLDNGLLLRSDVHTLFDRGYITVTPDQRVHVSRKLKDDFDNGEPYFPFNGRTIEIPPAAEEQPAREFLEWHANTVFRG
jgi:putative restriction endonuclease